MCMNLLSWHGLSSYLFQPQSNISKVELWTKISSIIFHERPIWFQLSLLPTVSDLESVPERGPIHYYLSTTQSIEYQRILFTTWNRSFLVLSKYDLIKCQWLEDTLTDSASKIVELWPCAEVWGSVTKAKMSSCCQEPYWRSQNIEDRLFKQSLAVV